MRAKKLSDILTTGDRVAVSNITGREASKVSVFSQQYCNNIVAGWALGKAGQTVSVGAGRDIPVYGQFEDLMEALPAARRPNKIIVYSPPDAVYGDVKEVLEYGKGVVETVFVITEHVSVEVTAKLRRLCDLAGVDILGCNTLGVINARKRVRVGAVGGNAPDESFVPGSAIVISNSGNMVNTIASYLQSAGLGISYGISTGKDVLILTPLKDLLQLCKNDASTQVVVLYCEPGGTYEREAVEWMQKSGFKKPLLVYIAGSIAEGATVSLGHAGAVVEGQGTSASAKMKLFDDYFGVEPFHPNHPGRARIQLRKEKRGIRVTTLHALAPAAMVLLESLSIRKDFRPKRPLGLNPWLVNLEPIAKNLPKDLLLEPGAIPAPYDRLVEEHIRSGLGRSPTRQSMRNASHASSNDGVTPRIYGYSVLKQMEAGSFAGSVLLAWLGQPARNAFEPELFERCLIASLTNGPGTISAQAAKLSASAGNEPNTAMMATLGAIGLTHGGNGKQAARMLIDVFGRTHLTDPYARADAPDLDGLARDFVADFAKKKAAAKEAGTDYERVPCLGHPVFNQDPVNYDPRERVVSAYMKERNLYNVFLEFYHRLSREMMEQGATNKAHAVNVDAVIACVLTAIAWPLLVEKRVSVDRVLDLPMLAFALGRVAGGAGEYLDHRESGTAMDMRIPVSECRFMGKEKD